MLRIGRNVSSVAEETRLLLYKDLDLDFGIDATQDEIAWARQFLELVYYSHNDEQDGDEDADAAKLKRERGEAMLKLFGYRLLQ